MESFERVLTLLIVMPTWTKLTKDDIKSTARTFQGYIISTTDNDVSHRCKPNTPVGSLRNKTFIVCFLLGQPSLKCCLNLKKPNSLSVC